MLYVKVNELGEAIELPISERTLREKFSNVSFPQIITKEDVEQLGYNVVPQSEPTEPPVIGQKIIIDMPEKVNGQFVRKFSYAPMSPNEIREKIIKMRAKRDIMLRHSDFSQLVDYQTKMTEEEKQAWINYREALRNIPQQELFPYVIEWPENPGKDPVTGNII